MHIDVVNPNTTRSMTLKIGAKAIVLGCAGMTDLARDLERKAVVPGLEGVACAVGLAESPVRLDLKTSKRNTYAAPLAKPYAGEFKRFSPGAG
jgi:allantoin racemase